MRLKNESFYLLSIVLSLILVLYAGAGHTQPVFFNHIAQEHGLRNGNVRAVVKDYQGFVWIGTEDGLHRYDGYSMKIYRGTTGDSTALGSNFILSLFEDSARNLWVGTLDGGLFLYNRKKDSFRKLRLPSRANSTANVAIRCIAEGVDHYVYVGSDNLVRTKIEADRVISFERVFLPADTIADSGIRISSITQGLDSNLLISVNTQGLFVYDPLTGKIYPHEINALEKNIQSLYVDRVRNLILIGSWKNGLLVYDPVRKIQRRITAGVGGQALRSNFIASMAGDASGNIWMATEEGLSVIPGGESPMENCRITTYLSGHAPKTGIHGVVFKTVYVDNEDRIWIGSHYEGLNVYDKHSMIFGSLDISLEVAARQGGGNVNALARDDAGNLWIGLDGGGLYHLREPISGAEPGSAKRVHIPPEIDKIKSMAVGDDRRLWIGTWGNGLWVFSSRTQRCEYVRTDADIGAYIISLESDASGNLWIGSFDKGLFRYVTGTGEIEKIAGVASNHTLIERINAIHSDPSGILWIGKEMGGLNVLRPGERHYKVVHTQDLDNATTISTIFQDRAGKLWVGVPFLGLVEYDPGTKQSKVHGEADGLANSSIYAIAGDGRNRLWLSHNAGLSVFDITSNSFINFNKNNGLTASQFNKNSVALLGDDEIVFGSIRGLSYFRPEDFKKDTSNAVVIFTRFFVNNVEQTPDGTVLSENITTANDVHLESDQNSFGIEFVDVDYTFHHSARCYYMLEGFDTKWQYAGERRLITYTSLEPGKYIFKVRTDSSIVRGSAGQQLEVTIIPAWWQTTLFKIILFVIPVLGFIAFYRIRVNFLLRQRNLLEGEVRSRTQKLNETVDEMRAMNILLHTQQEDIIKKNNEIQAQNGELLSQNEHIAEQRERLVEAQQQLRKINTDLEQTVAQRTEKLQHTIDDLNKVVFELDRFVYSASHDLRAPLKSIMGLVMIIDIEPDASKISGYIELIRTTVVKLDDVIQSMVEYARNSHTRVLTERINLHGLVDEVFKDLAFMPNASILVFENLVPGELVIQNDSMRLKVVLNNIISNGVKYIDKRKAINWLRIEADMIVGKASIKIADNGIGIKPEFIDKIFNMYFRATVTSNGSGLGLFIVKEAINKMGGQIIVHSQYGEGTTFDFVIPDIPQESDVL